jgi:soluble lytic murein transglycosylase-like protein
MAPRPDRPPVRRRVVAALALLAAAALPATARPADCERLVEQAAQHEGIPPGLMTAIARVESGRTSDGNFAAWPWTLNQGGDGSFHDSRAAAATALDALLAAGVTNVDIGCMQLNWRWHGHAFPDAPAMLDPRRNTAYAAQFLADLFAETGDWTEAVARYHSRDPDRGAAYAARVASLAQGGTTERAAGRGPVARAAQVQGILLLPGAPLLGTGAGTDLRRRPLVLRDPAEG